MGVKQLLAQLPAGATKHTNTKDLKDLRLAIDGHCLLHKCCMFAAKQVLLDNNLSSTVEYIINSVEKLLQYASSDSYLVFDGGCLGAKDGTMEMRKKAREMNLESARKEIAAGKSGRDYLLKAFSVTNEQLAKIANQISVRFPLLTVILSPAEADAYLAWLAYNKLVDAIVSVDSDLLLYGAPILVSKFDGKTGEIDIIRQEGVYTDSLKNKNNQDLQKLAVLAGCDYLQNLTQFGWVKIWKTMKENEFAVLKCVYQALTTCKGVQLPSGYDSADQYVSDLVKALLAFRYHVVFDLWTGTCVSLHAMDEQDYKLMGLLGGDGFCGVKMDDKAQAFRIVSGAVNGETLNVYMRLKIRAKTLGERPYLAESLSVYKLLQIESIDGDTISGAGFRYKLANKQRTTAKEDDC